MCVGVSCTTIPSSSFPSSLFLSPPFLPTYLPPEGELKAHCGVAVTPEGTSVGHWPLASHCGEQKLPVRPVI